MPGKDGFLTLLAINKGWKDRYRQLKWLWVGISVLCGAIAGYTSWLKFPHLIIPISVAGTFLGAALFYLFLKCLAEDKEKSE